MKITRRFFLRSTGALAAYCGFAPLHALADTAGALPGARKVKRHKTLVVIFLRGGADGLNLVVPYKDEHYGNLRSQLRIASPGQDNGAIDLDGFFGLHPRMKALAPLFESGIASAAHAVGYDKNTRSHFEEQDVWETGLIGNTIGSDGWLNRHLQTSEGHGPIRSIAVGDTLPRILRGKAPSYAVRGLTDLALPGDVEDQEMITAALEHAYKANPKEHAGSARDLLAKSGKLTLEGIAQLRAVTAKPYTPGAQYPNTDLARRLGEVARLIKSNVGLEVAEVDYGGWDTHNNQGYGIDGAFGNLAQTLGDAIAAFTQDMGDKMEDVLLLTLSDFGRTCKENGTNGTDHGWANCLFAAGGPVAKANKTTPKKVLSKWPGLAPDQLHQKRDLLHTTDFRDVIAEAVQVHLGNPNLKAVLPGHEFKKVELVEA